MNAGNIREFIAGLHDLPTIPSQLGKILKVVNDDGSSPHDLYNLISHDQALAVRVVQVANSAAFGHSGDVKDIKQAIMFLGYDRIKSLAIGMTIMDVFPAKSSFNMKNLWIHSYEVAFISAAMSDIIPMTSPRESFLSGLLHDIGRIIFHKIDYKKYTEIRTTDDMLEMEHEIFGCTHADAGAWFAEDTKMPEEIVSSIRYHHKPSNAKEYKDAVSIVSLAEALSRRFSPRIEDDGIWINEHDAILLEFSLSDEDLVSICSGLIAAKHQIKYIFTEDAV